MISKVRICGFKKIKDAEFELDRMNVFVGSNNSGKSSVLQAIQFAIGTAQTSLRVPRIIKKNGIERFSVEPSAFLYLPLRELEALIYERKLTQNTGADLHFYTDSMEEPETTIAIKRGKNRNFTITMKSSDLLEEFKNNQKPYCVYTPGVSGITLSEEYKTKAVVLKSATRGDSNLYLRNILYLLKEDKGNKWEQFSNTVKAFFPDFTVDVRFNPETDEIIDAIIITKTENGDDIELPIDAIGTSALQILQILSYVYYFEPPMLILDEPDTHLHPNNQRLLISLLDEISSKSGMQVLIATHSRHIMDEARDIASFFWMHDGELVKRINEEDSKEQFVQVLLDLGAMDACDLSNPNIKWVVCTEDARVSHDNYLKCVLEASGFDFDECKIIPYRGCGKTESVLFLREFLKSYVPNLKVIIHRDRDYLLDEEVEEFKSKFEREGIFVWVTPDTDIEALFTNPAHIITIYPIIGRDEIDEILDLIYSDQNVRKESTKRLANQLISIDKKNNTNPRHQPNIMEISEQTNSLYDANPRKYALGKKVLGLLKDNLQRRISVTPDLIKTTKALYQQELNDILNS